MSCGCDGPGADQPQISKTCATRRGGRGRGRGRTRTEATDPMPPTASPAPPAPSPDTAPSGLSTLPHELAATLGQRVYTLQTVPGKLRGLYKATLRTALALISSRPTPKAETQGWALFLLTSRMLLYREPGQTRLSAEELDRRAATFRAGDYASLLAAAATAGARATPSRPAAEGARADRATALTQLGELSAASHALTSEPLAPGTAATLAELQHPNLRPQHPYPDAPPLPRRDRDTPPADLPVATFLSTLRSARRGSAAGPSGATNEHLRLLLAEAEDIRLLHSAAMRLASADIPDEVSGALRIGRMVALRTSTGRVRALVIGDTFRRLVGRTLARHYAPALQRATLPFQFGLSTRAGTEAVHRCLQVATELDPQATILSLDAVGAFDHVSRGAMLQGLASRPDLAPLLPYAAQWYGSPSQYTWTDAAGYLHHVQQAEGGEQGDPLMPALYSIAQHNALAEVHATLRDGESIFAYLDDIYIVSHPTRTCQLYADINAALWDHARVQLNPAT